MRPLIILSLALLPVPAAAQTAPELATEAAPAAASALAGSWALQIDGATVFRFDIAPVGTGWQGTWHRPASFASGGDSFEKLSAESATVVSSGGTDAGEWTELTFPDNRPKAVPDVFRFRTLGPDRAEMVYVDTGLAPFTLVRVGADTPLGPFEAGKIYRRVSVETLGLPGDKPVKAPVETIRRRPKPADLSVILPPRQTDKVPTDGGR